MRLDIGLKNAIFINGDNGGMYDDYIGPYNNKY